MPIYKHYTMLGILLYSLLLIIVMVSNNHDLSIPYILSIVSLYLLLYMITKYHMGTLRRLPVPLSSYLYCNYLYFHTNVFFFDFFIFHIAYTVFLSVNIIMMYCPDNVQLTATICLYIVFSLHVNALSLKKFPGQQNNMISTCHRLQFDPI